MIFVGRRSGGLGIVGDLPGALGSMFSCMRSFGDTSVFPGCRQGCTLAGDKEKAGRD